MIYADNAATTKTCPAAQQAMLSAMEQFWGNPSSLHSPGQQAAEALQAAREAVARAIGAQPREIYFTSGGSEADNQAIVSAAPTSKSMEHVYAVQTARELAARQNFVRENQGRINEYIRFLEREYAAEELPRAIVWTTRPIAAGLVSDIPLPAYTNDFRVMFDPDLEDWRDIYLAQLNGLPDSEAARQVQAHYEQGLSQNHVLHILGHELAHHSGLFFDDAYETDTWFEEGMAEYIGRRYFLTAAEFDTQAEADRLLVELLTPRYGGYPLAQFGAQTYARDYAGIFFDYRRAFLAICGLVERYGGVQEVFRSCRDWHENHRDKTLAQWFHV